jgi:hypothetical protein
LSGFGAACCDVGYRVSHGVSDYCFGAGFLSGSLGSYLGSSGHSKNMFEMIGNKEQFGANSSNHCFSGHCRNKTQYNAKKVSSRTPIIPALTNRGFTGYEHIDEMGLIHMNGRVYDPRFPTWVVLHFAISAYFTSS